MFCVQYWTVILQVPDSTSYLNNTVAIHMSDDDLLLIGLGYPSNFGLSCAAVTSRSATTLAACVLLIYGFVEFLVQDRITVNGGLGWDGEVCLVDEKGDAIKTYRWAATADDDPAELAARMRWQLATTLRQTPHLQVGIVQDGAPEMWKSDAGPVAFAKGRRTRGGLARSYRPAPSDGALG